jgi:hypothetical protein
MMNLKKVMIELDISGAQEIPQEIKQVDNKGGTKK